MNNYFTVIRRFARLMLLTGILLFLMKSAVFADLSSMILIGDSRTNEMHDVVGDYGCTWSAANGMGYDWMTSKAIPDIEQTIGRDTAVVILMGVNDVPDIFRISEYADYLNEKASLWSEFGAYTYFVSILPVTGTPLPGLDNSLIEYWNDSIRELLSPQVTFLDVYHGLGDYYKTVDDGIHYNIETYRRIFDFVLAGVYEVQNDLSSAFDVVSGDEPEVPDMRYTAADTEDFGNGGADRYYWEDVNGSLICRNQNGELLTGLHIVGNMICVFGNDGILKFSRRS